MVWILLALAVTLPFGVAALTGTLPTLKRETDSALAIADLKPGQTIIDLGSGDGRLLLAAARRGLRGIGYEINPFMYLISLIVTFRYRRRITIHPADFWRDLWETVLAGRIPPTDAVYVFLLPRLMPDLERKLTSELVKPTPVISLAFEFPGRRPVTQVGSVRRYFFGES